MRRASLFVFATLISSILIPALSAHAQAPRMSTVNITAESDKVRVNAEGDISELRVNVADESGAVVFESGPVTMRSLDWQMSDSSGERVAAGTYLLSVTFRTTEGKLRKRVEQVTVAEVEKAEAREATNKPTPNAVQAVINGTGTSGRIAKFTGGATVGSSVIIESANKIGIGTAAPTSLLHVITSDATNPSVTGRNNATNGIGLFGYAPNGFAILGQSSTKTGVLGTSSSGDGVVGTSSSGKGVTGESGTGFGVLGFSSVNIGVLGQSSTGDGVVGLSTDHYGVRGQSNNYTAVIGISNSGTAVAGLSKTGAGLKGVSGSDNGVYAQSDTGDALVARTFNNTARAARFYGDVNIRGRLVKDSGSFQIDHPLDPANKYLSHSFVESPDMMNIYNGIITLDRKGQAVVVMPTYFSALNKDFRYQLTPIGAAAPRLYIAEEITNNRFRIAGGRPGMKVSWMVTGIRHDAYADAHRIPVEEDKPPQERGTYTHPELFGQPEEKSLAGAANQDSMNKKKQEEKETQPKQ